MTGDEHAEVTGDEHGQVPAGARADDQPATVVDARGLRCPIPVIRLARRAQTLAGGELVTVWSTDPAAVYDVPAWARMRGHGIEGSVTIDADGAEGPFQAITVRIGGGAEQ